MKRILALSILLLIGCGCQPETKETTLEYKLPPELSDCKVFKVESEREQNIIIVRCSESYVTTNWTERHGKATHRYTVSSN